MKKSYILIAAMAAVLCMAGCSSGTGSQTEETKQESEIVVETAVETETEAETETQAETEAETSQTEAQAETEAETEAASDAETEADDASDAETEADDASEDQTNAPETEADGENEDSVSDDPLDYISVYITDGQARQDALGVGEDEYPTLFVLTTQEEIYDVTLWRLDMYVGDDGELHGSETEFLGSLETLSPGKSQEMSIDPGETIPLAGFSFIDQENVVHHYYLSVSGEDGSAVINSYIWE